MKRWIVPILLAAGFAAAGPAVLAQAPRMPGRPMVSAVSHQVQVLTSDVVAVGRVEDAGAIEELDVVMPLTDKPAKRRFQKFRLFVGRIIRDTAGGAPVFSNTVVEVLAAVPPGVTNLAGCTYQKDLPGVFLMNRLAGRTELLAAPRHKQPMFEAMMFNIAASMEVLPWGQVSNGLQMAVIQLSPPMASTGEPSMHLGVAVRNVSNGPIAVNRGQAQKSLTVVVDGKEATVPEPPRPTAVASNAPAQQGIVILQAKQTAMVTPKGNADSGFVVNLPPGETWSVKARYEPIGESKDGPPFWKGCLESGALTVKLFRPPPRPAPPRVDVAPDPAAGQKPSPPEASREPSPAAPAKKPIPSATPQ